MAADDLLADLDDRSPHGLLDFATILFAPGWREEESSRQQRFSKFRIPSLDQIPEKLKPVIRQGIPCGYRRKLWFIASGGLELYKKVGNVWDSLVASCPEAPEKETLFFGGTLDVTEYLPPEASHQLIHFLTLVWSQNRELVFAPMMASISLFLLLFMEPPLAYLTIQAMINRSRNVSCYLATSHERFAASVLAVRELGSKCAKDIIARADRLGVSVSKLCLSFIPSFFLPYASLPASLTIFDSFVTEGRKIVTCLCAAVFHQARHELAQTETADDFNRVMTATIENFNGVPALQACLGKSFSITGAKPRQYGPVEEKCMKHRDQIPLIVARRRPSLPHAAPLIVSSRSETADYYPQPLRRRYSPVATVAMGRVRGGTLLTSESFRRLLTWAPIEVRRYAANIVFVMSENGTSFQGMLHAAAVPGYYVLIVQTVHRRVGAFLSESLQPGHRGFYGRPSTFVFELDTLKCHRAKTPPNVLFISVSSADLIIGGPDPAIELADEFKRMASKPCETFGSPSFAIDEAGDEILEVELYRLVPPT
jgi:hypothetical protein